MSRLRFASMIGVSALVLAAIELAPRAHAQSVTPAVVGEPAVVPPDQLARGAYIVEDVAQCGRCHTPIDKVGERDRNRRLMGGPLDVEPTQVRQNWAMAAPRIAGMPPGTDEQFVTLMMTGISRTGRRPLRPMPQFKMTQADAEAVLAYLKSLDTHR